MTLHDMAPDIAQIYLIQGADAPDALKMMCLDFIGCIDDEGGLNFEALRYWLMLGPKQASDNELVVITRDAMKHLISTIERTARTTVGDRAIEEARQVLVTIEDLMHKELP